MIIKSYAKINLSLNITGKNKQNYHKIHSIFAFLDIFDKIEIQPSDKYSLIIKNNQQLAGQKDNLITKIINLLKKEYPKIHNNFTITLEKNIPIGAGLGGGSSNAGAILLAFNQIFNLNLSNQQLINLAIQVGSDIPFFTQKNAAIIENIGDKIQPIDHFTNMKCVIINPNIKLSTKDVFDNFNPKDASKVHYNNHRINDFLKIARNDLAKSACQLATPIKEILTFINALDNVKYSQMSGSGSTCYVIFQEGVNIDQQLAVIQKQFPKYLTCRANILSSIGNPR